MSLKPTIIPNTRPAVWLSAAVRLAIRDFARAHGDHQVLRLEEIVGATASEFYAIHGSDPWFAAQPAHTFDALEVAGGDHSSQPLDRLCLVVKPDPGATGGLCILYIYTPAEHPLDETYHVARVIQEARYIDTRSLS